MDGTAIILTSGLYTRDNGKTAHGLVRGTERFKIVGVVDSEETRGKDAGELLDGTHRGIPIFASIAEAHHSLGQVDYCIIGVALPGGKLSKELKKQISQAMAKGMSIVNGLHTFLNEDPEMAFLTVQHEVNIFDIRMPKPKEALSFWSGEIFKVPCPKIAVLGMDCAVGKRTTAKLLMEKAREKGLKAQMIYTGQTGWLQGFEYGFILDSTYNDFVAGELEKAIVNCYKNEQPDIIFVEGQSALRNPSGPCGAELLLSGNMDGVILQHIPGRQYWDDNPAWGEMPSVKSEIELIKLYGKEVLGITLNTSKLPKEQIKSYQQECSAETGVPTFLPLEEDVETLVEVLTKKFNLG
ncbi:DUF1611 domain-containing protein [Rapidithrix thailandica]|uniref:DUF1611 domain-containing protein n=1 Tax=Rapidithrix thailandica TaxID=413964 RepID=A0AAW9SFD6_9BACT